jgi:hypothetical protein
MLERHDTVLLDANGYDFFLASLGPTANLPRPSRAPPARYQLGPRQGVR